jgi:DNA repair protein RadA/Sms
MREVDKPSALFLAERPKDAAGSVIGATAEGSRAMLVEVQALVSPFSAGAGRRVTSGIDGGRLAMILAILERKAGLAIGASDVFVNVAGGVRVEEPAIDLAVALAVASSLRDRPASPDIVAFGELGLAGEVRGVTRAQHRMVEAAAMGFTRAIVPVNVAEGEGIEALRVKTLVEALDIL